MTQKNEAPVLIAALAITVGLLGIGVWAFRGPLGGLLNSASEPTGTSGPIGSSNGVGSGAQGAGTFADVQTPTGLFSYGGSTTWAPIRGMVDSALQTAHPQFQLRYADPASGSPGSSSGVRMVLDGQLAFAQSSRPLKDEEYQQAQQRGVNVQQVAVAIDGIAIAVHPDLTAPGLTIAQLKDIYTGNITNWSQVGGPNLPLTPYSRTPEAGGTVEFFVDNVLGQQPFGNTVKLISTTTEALRQVATDPGGLYYGSAPELVPQCTVKPLPVGRQPGQLVPPYQGALVSEDNCPAQRNQLNAAAFQSGEYPITRQLFVVVKQDGQSAQQAGEAYAQLLLTDQGQTLIDQAGFVRIR